MEEGLSDPANSNVMKVIQSITAVIGFFIPAFIAATLLNRKPVTIIGLFYSGNKAEPGGAWSVLLVGSALFVSSSLSYFNNHIPIPEAWKIRFDKMELEYNTRCQQLSV